MTEWIQNKVTPPCAESRRVGQERQNQLTKPQGSLGRLEGLAIDFAGLKKPRCPVCSISPCACLLQITELPAQECLPFLNR
jgi:NaMN:DMB phosphoribosyltransferase